MLGTLSLEELNFHLTPPWLWSGSGRPDVPPCCNQCQPLEKKNILMKSVKLQGTMMMGHRKGVKTGKPRQLLLQVGCKICVLPCVLACCKICVLACVLVCCKICVLTFWKICVPDFGEICVVAVWKICIVALLKYCVIASL